MNIRRLRRFSLRHWWRLNQPVRCAACGRWLRLKDAQPAIHSVAGQVLLCGECDRRLNSWRGA